MTAETDLTRLLHNMRPELNQGDYVFCSLPTWDGPSPTGTIASFREREGQTFILPKTTADALGWEYPITCAWITLTVNSSLEAVGLTAAVSTALGRVGISCNMVAAYYHDHIFIPSQDATRAMHSLLELSAAS